MEHNENNVDGYTQKDLENEDELMKEEVIQATKKALSDWKIRKNRRRLRAQNVKGKGLFAATSGVFFGFT